MGRARFTVTRMLRLSWTLVIGKRSRINQRKGSREGDGGRFLLPVKRFSRVGMIDTRVLHAFKPSQRRYRWEH